ncbi:MAG: ferredoxin [archaeon]
MDEKSIGNEEVFYGPRPILGSDGGIDMGTYTIEYDRSKCIGAANCVAIAPDTWELAKDGLADCKLTNFDEKVLQKNLDAATGCPTHAIVIKDENGKPLV